MSFKKTRKNLTLITPWCSKKGKDLIEGGDLIESEDLNEGEDLIEGGDLMH